VTGVERATVCVIGGGVVGVSVALALARRQVDVVLVEAEPELGLAASGTNSGILHTGFDSPPGTLETRLLLRSAELRHEVLDALRPPLLRPGGVLRPRNQAEQAAVAALEHRAAENGVPVQPQQDGSVIVPGEMVTNPVAYTLCLAASAKHAGARVICGARIDSIPARNGELFPSVAGDPVARCKLAVNCAGLFADDLARAAGDDHFAILPRKGEFFVFEPPDGRPLERILLAVPSEKTKGVLVFPTTDGNVIAGPTAIDQRDKHDWSVRPEARDEVIGKAAELMPELEGQEPIGAYAGLRTAGASGENYLIEQSSACPTLLHVAAIRSTGLSASLGIAEYVLACLERMGLALGAEQPLQAGQFRMPAEPWWQRSARYWMGKGD
jgi:glycerol-3-phosphate dehydrogenase